MSTKAQKTKKQLLLEAIQESGKKGISPKAASEKIDQTVINLQRSIYELRGEGHIIPFLHDKKVYVYKGQTDKSTRPKDKGKRTPVKRQRTPQKDSAPAVVDEEVSAQSTSGNGYFRLPPSSKIKTQVKNLDPEDQAKYLGYLREAQFYLMCAQAILDSDEKIHELERSILA